MAVVQVLVEGKARVSTKDRNGGTALHSAASGVKSVVEYLLEKGASPHARDNDGRLRWGFSNRANYLYRRCLAADIHGPSYEVCNIITFLYLTSGNIFTHIFSYF